MNDAIMKENGKSSSGAAREAGLAEVLERIDRRTARLEALALRLESMEKQAPSALAAAVDTLDGLAAKLQERDIDIDERMRNVAKVMERLTSPEALKAVCTVLDKLEMLQRLLDSGILEDGPVDVVSRAGAALAQAHDGKSREVGLWGAMRAMNDEDVRRAVGFLLEVARRFGKSLDQTGPERQLGA